MSKHTAGPWVVDHGGTKGHIKSISRSLTPIGKGTKNEYIPTPTICRYDGMLVVADTLTKQEKQANARLIAAAPDMLDALIACYNHIKNDMTVRGIGMNARRAIESATGQSIDNIMKEHNRCM